MKFIRKNGRVIPIREKKVKPSTALLASSYTAAVASGVVSAAGFHIGGKVAIIGGEVASKLIGVGSSVLGVQAHTSQRGSKRSKAVGIVKTEAINQALGWGTFGAIMVANPKTRNQAINGAKAVGSFIAKHAKKVL